MILKSLIARVILLNILLMAVGIGIFTLIHVHREQDHLLVAERESAELLLNVIEKSIFTAMRDGDSATVQQILEMVGHTRRLLGVRIFHPDGTVLKSSNPLEIGHSAGRIGMELFQRQQSDALFRSDGRQILALIRPIVTDERCFRCHGVGRRVVGVLALDLDLGKMTQRLEETSNSSFFAMLILIALFSAGISFILLRFVRRPIQVMGHTMSRVEAGDLSARLPRGEDDEIGSLMRSFNSMVDNLETAKKELEQYHFRQMERADRLASVGEMATGIAHEIKNPLAGISGAVSVLADDYPPDDPRREIVGKVLEQIARLDKTATDLLLFGKPGKPDFNFVDVNELLKKTLFFVSQHPEARNVHRIHELTRDLPPVWVDEKQIQQIFFNIIINAIQAMADGGTLTVTTEANRIETQEFVQVTVSDTGKGIAPDDLEKIFVPFFTTKTQGTGLGLPICRQILEQHGGSISVESRLQEGTTFRILLPVTATPEPSPGEDHSA